MTKGFAAQVSAEVGPREVERLRKTNVPVGDVLRTHHSHDGKSYNTLQYVYVFRQFIFPLQIVLRQFSTW